MIRAALPYLELSFAGPALRATLQRMNTDRLFRRVVIWLGLMLIALAACEPAAAPLIPTDRPTASPSPTASATHTPGPDATSTPRPTRVAQAEGGPSPTPLIGPTRTPQPGAAISTPTRAFNPNAPRVEFFTSDPLAVEPGSPVVLFWSVRGTDNVVIYRLNEAGERTLAINAPPDGSREVSTRRSERGTLDFILIAGQGDNQTEQFLSIPLRCPVTWFFSPAPDVCAADIAEESLIAEQRFERGRMLYIESRNTIYVLFNDGQQPAWLGVENRYDPTIHPERDPNFPPQFIQPIAELGFVWRGSDSIRNRLGIGAAEETRFEGFVQVSRTAGGAETLYISSGDGQVIRIQPDGAVWELIGPG